MLTALVGPDAIPIPMPSRRFQAQAESDAARALRQRPGEMALSERLQNPDAYRALQGERRAALESLLVPSPSEAVVAKAIDFIVAIAEETTWSANEPAQVFDDESHPEIDFQCAETAVLFGWTIRILGDSLNKISPRIVRQMQNEIRRRVLRPVQTHDDYPFLCGEGACPMAIAADLLLTCLLAEHDSFRASRLIRPLLKLLDEVCGRHGRAIVPLTDCVTDIAAVSDLAVLLKEATSGAFDLTQTLPAGDWLDEILFSWICEDYFIDPAGDGMKPALSGSDVFRIGATAGDEPLASLGAKLYRANLPSRTVTGRLLDRGQLEHMDAVSGHFPPLRYAATRNNLLMAAWMSGLYCSLHVGGGQGNVGDVCLFADGVPILVDGGRACPARSVPILAGKEQLRAPSRPCIASFEDRAGKELLSVDMTHAYPDECGLRSYQRTVLTLRSERAVRVVDALDFGQPSMAAFVFVTAVRPTALSTAIRLGSVRMTWEGDLTVSVSPLPDGLSRIELATVEPVRQALFSFNFESA